jgi:hypothetical protein
MEDVTAPFVALPEHSALHHSVVELELVQVSRHRLQVVVGELFPEHGEEARESVRAEAVGLLVGDLAQSP